MIRFRSPEKAFIIDSGPPTDFQRPPPNQKRRILVTLLGGHLLLLFLVFPLLIVYFENEYAQPEPEVVNEPGLINRIDVLHWTLVTPNDAIANHVREKTPHLRHLRNRRSKETEPDPSTPLPQVYFREERSAPRHNQYPPKISAIIVFVLFERNHRRKDRDDPDEDLPSL